MCPQIISSVISSNLKKNFVMIFTIWTFQKYIIITCLVMLYLFPYLITLISRCNLYLFFISQLKFYYLHCPSQMCWQSHMTIFYNSYHMLLLFLYLFHYISPKHTVNSKGPKAYILATFSTTSRIPGIQLVLNTYLLNG